MSRDVCWKIATAGLLGIVVLAALESESVRPLLNPFAQFTAYITGQVIQILGIDVGQNGTVIFRPYVFAYEINYRCIGVLPVSALAIALIVSPVGFGAKLIGMAIGVPLVLVLNVVRLVHLFELGVNHPDYFWLAHRVLWEAAMLGSVLLIWVVWMRWSSGAVRRNRTAV